MAHLNCMYQMLLCLFTVAYVIDAHQIYGQMRSPRLGERELYRRQNQYLNIARGILRAHSIAGVLDQIPCSVVSTLENDAAQAGQFISQLEQGKVPTLISDLPEEVTGAFKGLVDIFETLPTAIVDGAETVATEAVKIFDDISDGKIVSDIEAIPGEVVSLVTAGWNDLTSGVEDAWHGFTCLFGGCTTTTSSGTCMPDSTTLTPAHTPTIRPVTPTAAPVATPTAVRQYAPTVVPQSTHTAAPVATPTTIRQNIPTPVPQNTHTASLVNTPASPAGGSGNNAAAAPIQAMATTSSMTRVLSSSSSPASSSSTSSTGTGTSSSSASALLRVSRDWTIMGPGMAFGLGFAVVAVFL